jgi:hypothetical protein
MSWLKKLFKKEKERPVLDKVEEEPEVEEIDIDATGTFKLLVEKLDKPITNSWGWEFPYQTTVDYSIHVSMDGKLFGEISLSPYLQRHSDEDSAYRYVQRYLEGDEVVSRNIENTIIDSIRKEVRRQVVESSTEETKELIKGKTFNINLSFKAEKEYIEGRD